MDSLLKKQFALDELMPLIRERLKAGQNVRIYPNGTSMLPMIRQGVDSVVLSPLPEKLRKFDIPLYQRKSGQYVLHRIVKTGSQYTCIGDNQFNLEFGIEPDQMIAVVSAFYRGGHLYSVRHPLYRLYYLFWHYSRPGRKCWLGFKALVRRVLK